VSATNQGVAAGPAVLSVGTSQSNVSVTDGLIAIPEMAMNETLALAPIEVTINRRHLDQVDNIQRGAFFEPDDVALCVMPEPVPGMALPESDPAIATIDQFTTSCVDLDFGNPDWKRSLPQPPRVEFTQGRRYLWNMLTSEGSMTFELLPEHAAHHVSAIIYLVRLGFYDDLSFHRVVQGFVAQGGDPDGTGGGGPGYTLAGEFDPSVSHDGRGVLSTANSGPVSDGSQFFITFAATPHLDGLHTIAGRLVEGADVLTSIEALAAPPTCGSNCAPSSPISITGGSILVE
jgi:peptidylprolyl isomerase